MGDGLTPPLASTRRYVKLMPVVLCPPTRMQQERRLFFEFIKGVERFELRNGLDHYRVRPRARRRNQDGFGDGNDGTTRYCGEDDGATVLHLGPMLKASIRFYV